MAIEYANSDPIKVTHTKGSANGGIKYTNTLPWKVELTNDDLAYQEDITNLQRQINALEADLTWRDPVTNYEDLPTTGNDDGDVRLVTSTGVLYVWAGSEWVALNESKGGITKLTEADYNWNSSTKTAVEPYDSIALWLLPDGIYKGGNIAELGGSNKVRTSKDNSITDVGGFTFLVSSDSNDIQTAILATYAANVSGSTRIYVTTKSNGAPNNNQGGASGLAFLFDNLLVQTTGSDSSKIMSQKAVTDAIAAMSDGAFYAYSWFNLPDAADSDWHLFAQREKQDELGAYAIKTAVEDGRDVFLVLDNWDGDNYYQEKILPLVTFECDKDDDWYEVEFLSGEEGKLYTFAGYGDYLEWTGKKPLRNTVVQAPGTSTTDVMSQNATTSMVYADPSAKKRIKMGASATIISDSTKVATSIGNRAKATGANSIAISGNKDYDATASGTTSIMIGRGSASNIGSVAIGIATASGQNSICLSANNNTSGGMQAVAINGNAIGNGSVAIGIDSSATGIGSVALGAGTSVTTKGVVGIGTANTNFGYNSSNYRLLTGLYDPVDAHDAATKGYVDGLVGDIEAALNVINNGESS